MNDAMIFFEMLILAKCRYLGNDKIFVFESYFIHPVGRNHRADIINSLYRSRRVVSVPCVFYNIRVVDHTESAELLFLFFPGKKFSILFQSVWATTGIINNGITIL